METQLVSVRGNSQRLDGGAMFGNAPRIVWEQWLEPDAHGLVPLATRALLIREESGRHVLLETGVGAFFPPHLRARYGVDEARHVLIDNLADLGVEPADIDVIVLSHLHFDHAGGLLASWSDGHPAALAFPTATVVVSADAWARARRPHRRDRASFIPELPELLVDGALEIVDGDRSTVLGPDYRFHFSHGHTPGLMLTEVGHLDRPVVFATDLIPGCPWVHLPITMGYDRCPELVVDEKSALLDDLRERGARLFFTHDESVAMAQIERSAEGRYRCGTTWPDGVWAVGTETDASTGR